MNASQTTHGQGSSFRTGNRSLPWVRRPQGRLERGLASIHFLFFLSVTVVMSFATLPMLKGKASVQPAMIVETINQAKSMWANAPTTLSAAPTTVPTWEDIAPYIIVSGAPLDAASWPKLLEGTPYKVIHINDLQTAPTLE